MKRRRKIPIWLRHLDRSRAELRSVRFPRSAEEGFRECARLSENNRRWLLSSIRTEHPGANDEQIEKERVLLLARLSAAEARWLKKWKGERERYFR